MSSNASTSPSLKPLPALPTPSKLKLSGPPPLTPLARAHLEQLIALPTKEAGLDDYWVQVILDGVEQMEDCMRKEEWLCRFREGRMSRSKAGDIVESKKSKSKMKKEEKQKEKEKQKEMEESKDNEKDKDTTKDSDESPDEPKPKKDTRQQEKNEEKEKRENEALSQLRLAISSARETPTNIPNTPQTYLSHLLLTVAPQSTSSQPAESLAIPSVKACNFQAGIFTLPPAKRVWEPNEKESVKNEVKGSGVVLFGLREWNLSVLPFRDRLEFWRHVKLIGGTFSFTGVPSPEAHQSLSNILYFSVYVFLSVQLELSVLQDHHIKLIYAATPSPVPPSPNLEPEPELESEPPSPTSPLHRIRSKRAKITTGIFNYISKKAEDFIHHHRRPSSSASASISRSPRGASLDLHPTTSTSHERPTRLSDVGALFRSSLQSSAKDFPMEPPPKPPFTATLEQLEKNKSTFSTSPDVTFPPPTLLVQLSEKEGGVGKDDRMADLFGLKDAGDETIKHSLRPKTILSSYDKAGLMSISGWHGLSNLSGMIGSGAFVRHQGLTVLYSEKIPISLAPIAEPSSDTTSSNSVNRISVSCFGPRWKTYRYYNPTSDKSLGQLFRDFCMDALSGKSCGTGGCKVPRAFHELNWVHNGVRIHGLLGKADGAADGNPEKDPTLIWTSCKVCQSATDKKEMTDGTFLFSFAKYLELLIYSSSMAILDPPLCEHSSDPTSARFNLLRHFGCGRFTFTMTLSKVESIYQMHGPRLQVVKPGTYMTKKEASDTSSSSGTDEEEKDDLRLEITHWWKGVKDYLLKLQEYLDDEVHIPKKLPARPPDATLRPPASNSRPALSPKASFTKSESGKSTSEKSTANTSSPSQGSSPLSTTVLLNRLRADILSEEQNLYTDLAKSSIPSINDVRRSFQSAARAAEKRIDAWLAKHTPSAVKDGLGKVHDSHEGPEWWTKDCHVMPDSRVIVREHDWGSIIAFMLSSHDYRKELEKMTSRRRHSGSLTEPNSGTATPVPSDFMFTTASNPSAMISANSKRSQQPTTGASQSPPDPDVASSWNEEPEECSTVITRKEHPRDVSSLLGLRDIIRHKDSSDNPRSGSVMSSVSKLVSSKTPPSAWTKPNVEVSLQAADGRVTATSTDEALSDQVIRALSLPTPTTEHESEDATVATSSILSSLSSQGSTIVPEPSTIKTTQATQPDDTRSKSMPELPTETADNSDTSGFKQASLPPESPHASAATGSISIALANAMRFILNSGPDDQPKAAKERGRLDLLASDPDSVYNSIDERPHIKYDWTMGKRLKFNCTAYFAKEFEFLRQRCNTQEVLLRSLRKSQNWNAEGGKSKSNFFKTHDDRFIIKTLVNAWNVADLQVLLELAPSYFRYMDHTASKPSVIAKLMGFYTIEIRNLESGSITAKADLLIMENLFYAQKITGTFDLKGIQGRKVKGAGSNSISRTLMDSDWIEGQQKALLLLQPHSRTILQEAVKEDANFLSKSNIMDYSLLVGVDEERREIACGLVDTIGSYTFAKTLEYKAKQGLNHKKEVTVIPPAEYAQRFVKAMDNYFVACPDKWTRHSLDSDDPSDIRELPSIL